MDCFCLQDWVTIQGASGVLSITQGENGWIDLAGYQDVVAWLDVREYSNGNTKGSSGNNGAGMMEIRPPGSLFVVHARPRGGGSFGLRAS